MSITSNTDILASDFINNAEKSATPANNAGKVTKLEADGMIHATFLANSAGYGDGSDGDVTISSPTTLTRDMYYNNLTVNNVLTTDGYRIFVKNLLTGNGTIKWGVPNAGSAGAGPQPSGGSGGAGGAQSGSGDLKNVAGANGGGTSNCGPGTAGGTGTAQTSCIGSTGANGGIAGGLVSGTYVRGAAGSGGTVTGPVRKFGVYKEYTINCMDRNGVTLTLLVPQGQAGGGGGGGFTCMSGGSGANGAGGGGGASGGIIIIVARNITGTFTIEANGANGGNGGNSVANGGGGGGGGGGNGGHIVLIFNSNTWTGTTSVLGGTGGTAGTTNSGSAGSNGSNGVAGTVKQINIFDLV